MGLRDYLERTVLYGTGSYERNNDGNNVHSQLELEELGDGIVHVATPHHRLDYAREVVVGEDDVGSLLCHISASNAHCKTDVSLLNLS